MKTILLFSLLFSLLLVYSVDGCDTEGYMHIVLHMETKLPVYNETLTKCKFFMEKMTANKYPVRPILDYDRAKIQEFLEDSDYFYRNTMFHIVDKILSDPSYFLNYCEHNICIDNFLQKVAGLNNEILRLHILLDEYNALLANLLEGYHDSRVFINFFEDAIKINYFLGVSNGRYIGLANKYKISIVFPGSMATDPY